MEAVRIEHPLEPIYAVDSRVLVLGTMPSPKSREIGFYYGHPQNRFWKVMGALFDEPEPLGIEGRAAFLDAHGIALWDVLSSCTIVGASDASIVDPLRTIFRALPRRRRSKPCSPRARRRRRSIAASARRNFPALRTRDFLPPVLRTRACASTIL